ncbi:MAG TPA: universal stress protein [Albitalea sp.]|nr:universal stress protein [Albitalea sp.]
MKILLPVDGSAYTKRMLSYIAAHDELLGREHEYTVFTVVAPIPGYAASFLEPKMIEDYHLQQAAEVLQPVRSFAEQQGWTFTCSHVVGHAAAAIAELAQAERFDLIVMGTHGHSAMGNVVLGSVTTGVLARCKTPMLLVR